MGYPFQGNEHLGLLSFPWNGEDEPLLQDTNDLPLYTEAHVFT